MAKGIAKKALQTRRGHSWGALPPSPPPPLSAGSAASWLAQDIAATIVGFAVVVAAACKFIFKCGKGATTSCNREGEAESERDRALESGLK